MSQASSYLTIWRYYPPYLTNADRHSRPFDYAQTAKHKTRLTNDFNDTNESKPEYLFADR